MASDENNLELAKNPCGVYTRKLNQCVLAQISSTMIEAVRDGLFRVRFLPIETS
jgi:hypothetical protein